MLYVAETPQNCNIIELSKLLKYGQNSITSICCGFVAVLYAAVTAVNLLVYF